MTKHEDDIIDIDGYRSIVGKLLYYVTKIAPACSNAVRELSQHMQSPGEMHWRALGIVIGYLKSKKDHTLVYRKPEERRSISLVDSNYATNVENRKSVSGYIYTIGGMITNWGSKRKRLLPCLVQRRNMLHSPHVHRKQCSKIISLMNLEYASDPV